MLTPGVVSGNLSHHHPPPLQHLAISSLSLVAMNNEQRKAIAMAGQGNTGLSNMPEGAQQQSRRMLWNKETGEQRAFYHIDARAVLSQKNPEYVQSPALLSAEVQKRIGYSVGTPIKTVVPPAPPMAKATGTDDEDEEEDDLGDTTVPPPAPTTWDDWSEDDLRNKAREFKVRKFTQKTREELIASLTEVGVIPSDDKFVTNK